MNYTKKGTKPQRLDESFLRDLRFAAAKRISKRLSEPLKDEISVREMTRMATTAPSYPSLIKELSTLPKRRYPKK